MVLPDRDRTTFLLSFHSGNSVFSNHLEHSGMKKCIHLSFILVVIAVSAPIVFGASPDNIWTEVSDFYLRSTSKQRTVIPDYYRTFRLNKDALRSVLRQAPMEYTDAARNDPTIITLPMPDGTFARFSFVRSPVIEPGLAVKFPELNETFRGQGIDDPTATARFDFLPSGFHSMILSANGTVMVDPYATDDTDNYIAYVKEAAPKTSDFICEFEDEDAFKAMSRTKGFDPSKFVAGPEGSENVVSGTEMRTYRLALAATGEYTQAVGGGTVAGALAAQVLIMNRVNGVYERDVAIHMNIIANNDLIVYTDGSTDPYTNSSGGTMLSQNTTTLNSIIGSANYDIGHVFSTGGGGVATLNGPCGSNKARGVTGLGNPVGDPFAIDYVAHEMGHQWGANHTFNSVAGSCAGGNRSSGSAYEPGSGITIMAYAGICSSQDLARHSIDTFHVKSLEAIVNYSQNGNGDSCAVTTATGNTPPVVSSAGSTSYNVPKQTPFVLTASATDADGDTITYDWQEYDLGGSTTAIPNTDADGIARPIFRPYSPVSEPHRYFPSMQYILNNANVPPSTSPCVGGGTCLTGELLPAITRTMNFQVIARDNNADGGGINTVTVSLHVDGNSGPFEITAPNGGGTMNSGTTQTVTWNVNGTSSSPVNAANVAITMSMDGGQTFPIVLAASTPNDGSYDFTVPAVSTGQARIKVAAVDNVFFDISNGNFSVVNVPVANGTLSGRIVDSLGNPIRGVGIGLSGGLFRRSTVTNSFGYFQFSLIPTGATYTITPISRRGMTFSPSSISVDFDGEGTPLTFTGTNPN